MLTGAVVLKTPAMASAVLVLFLLQRRPATTDPLPYHSLGAPQSPYFGRGFTKTGRSTMKAAHLCGVNGLYYSACCVCASRLVISASDDCVC